MSLSLMAPYAIKRTRSVDNRTVTGGQHGQALVSKEMMVYVIQGRITAALSLNTATVGSTVPQYIWRQARLTSGSQATHQINVLIFPPGKSG
jgi:hypothetical protein